MKIIHVNINIIRYNNQNKTTFPVCRVQEGSKSRYCESVEIKGPSRLVSRPYKPLPCGARVWIETESDVELINECEYKEIKSKMGTELHGVA